MFDYWVCPECGSKNTYEDFTVALYMASFCRDCNHSWFPKRLKQNILKIEKITGFDIDLRQLKYRCFYKSFIYNIDLLQREYIEIQKKYYDLKSNCSSNNFIITFLTSLVICIIFYQFNLLFIISVSICFVLCVFSILKDLQNLKYRQSNSIKIKNKMKLIESDFKKWEEKYN